MTRGVLQGEILCIQLFSLLLSNLERFLGSRGCRGISINSRTEVLLLAYADYIVLLIDNPTDLIRILDAFAEYCIIKKLDINTTKTQINFTAMNFENKPIKIVDIYTYLGVIFSDNCPFITNTLKTIDKTNIAIDATLKTIHQSKAYSWDLIEKLHSSLITSTLTYASHICSLEYLELMEKTYLQFFKRILRLPTNSPACAVRLETGITSIKTTIFKLILNW